MKQASFPVANFLNKDKNKISEYIINVQKESNKNIERVFDNKNIIITNTKIYNKPRKLVENIYYF